MFEHIPTFLVYWGLTSASLWVASFVFKGMRFSDSTSLLVAALVLGFVNAIVRPIMIVLTLPLTLLTLGLFLLVINALMLMLVSKLIRGFSVSSFGTAFFASIFISVLSFFLGVVLFGGGVSWNSPMPMQAHTQWL